MCGFMRKMHSDITANGLNIRVILSQPAEKLAFVTRYLRSTHCYCIWCGTAFDGLLCCYLFVFLRQTRLARAIMLSTGLFVCLLLLLPNLTGVCPRRCRIISIHFPARWHKKRPKPGFGFVSFSFA